MRRWFGLTVAAQLTVGCVEGSNPSGTVRDRNEAVLSTAGPSSTTAPGGTSSAPPTKPPRALCSSRPRAKTPDTHIDTAAAPGAYAPPTPIPFGSGRWIWVNLWAAWCGPCKEELPRLLKWQKVLRKIGISLEFAFVSMDDDERQMARFLVSQPPDGVRSTYWLKEGDRAKWLGPFGISEAATLPVHALVSPKGEVACVIEGALEESDFPQLRAVFQGG